VSALPAIAVASGIPGPEWNESSSDASTTACGTSPRLIPKSSAAMATAARPSANANREALPGCVSARPRVAKLKAVMGFIAAEPQLDSKGSDAHHPTSAAAAIVTAARPAT
jgi:hypothetical protein